MTSGACGLLAKQTAEAAPALIISMLGIHLARHVISGAWRAVVAWQAENTGRARRSARKYSRRRRADSLAVRHRGCLKSWQLLWACPAAQSNGTIARITA